MLWFWIGLGGFLGANTRYGLVKLVTKWAPASLLPLGTMAVNVLGCLAIGLIYGYTSLQKDTSHTLHGFLLVGFLGGFTTFSSFGLEAYQLISNKHALSALIDVGLQVGVGILAVAIGCWLSQLRVG
jgi:fluoride exporter